MTTGMSEEEIYKEAKKRVEAKRDFYVHLAVYVCVNIFLIIIRTFPRLVAGFLGLSFSWVVGESVSCSTFLESSSLNENLPESKYARVLLAKFK